MRLVTALVLVASLRAGGVDEVWKKWKGASAPGGAVAVIHNGRIVLARGFGSANLEHRIRNTAKTVFPAASVSKQFTAMAVLLLEKEGKLSLSDSVYKYLPELPDYHHDITVDHLLRHTAGIRDQWQLWELSGERMHDVITNDHILRLLFRQKGLDTVPGSQFLYSNGGYSLAAEIVARVSNASFAEFCRKAIFLPLGMSNTHFRDDVSRVVPNRAESYRRLSDGTWTRAVYNYATVGPTGLETTVVDLTKWLDNFRTQRLGGPTVFAKMRQRTTLTNGSTVPNGLGVGVAPMLGSERVGHNGGDAGFRSSVSYLYGPALGVAVLGNAADFDAAGIASSVAAVLLKLPGRGQTTDSPSPVQPRVLRAQKGVPVSQLKNLEGAYRLGGGGIVDVRLNSDGTIDVSLPFRPHTRASVIATNRLWLASEAAELEFPGGEPSLRVKQEFVRTGTLIRNGAPPAPRLQDYWGQYDSDEVDTSYVITSQDTGLVITHRRLGVSHPRVIAEDHLLDLDHGLGELRFERDERGQVVGFRAGSWRTPGVRFIRR